MKILLGFISILLARNLVEAEYSNALFILMAINLAVNISSGYFNRFIFIGNNRQKFIDNKLLGVKIILSTFSGIFYLSLCLISGFEFNILCLLGLLSVGLKVTYTFIQSRFQFEENFRRYYINDFMRTILYVLPTLLYFYTVKTPRTIDVIGFFSVSFGVLFIYGILDFLKSKRYQALELKNIDFDWYVFGFTAILMALASLDLIILKSYGNDYELTNYGAALTIYSFLMLGLSSVHKLLLPRISGGTSDVISRSFSTLRLASIFLFILYLLCLPFSHGFFSLLYGADKYVESYSIFNILALSAVLSFLFSPYINVLNRTGDFAILLVLVSITMLIMIPAHVLAYLHFNIYGIAVVTLIGNLFFNFSVMVIAKKRLSTLKL